MPPVSGLWFGLVAASDGWNQRSLPAKGIEKPPLGVGGGSPCCWH